MTPAVSAALALRGDFARGGSIAPGLPAAPFAAIPTPTIATPGLASPHGMLAAHRRAHFADGGLSLPLARSGAALALRPHFDDGGDVSDQARWFRAPAASGGVTGRTAACPRP